MSLAHIDISQPFNAHKSDEYEPGVPAHHKRGKARPGKPRAARVDDLEARLHQIGREVIVAWHEGRP